MGKKKKRDDLTYEDQIALMNETSRIAQIFLQDPDKDIRKQNPIQKSIMDFREEQSREERKRKKKNKKKKKNMYSGLIQPRNSHESAFEESEEAENYSGLTKQLGKAVRSAMKSTGEVLPSTEEEEVIIHEDPNNERYADMIMGAMLNGYRYQGVSEDHSSDPEEVEYQEEQAPETIPLVQFNKEGMCFEVLNEDGKCASRYAVDFSSDLVDFMEYAIESALRDLKALEKMDREKQEVEPEPEVEEEEEEPEETFEDEEETEPEEEVEETVVVETKTTTVEEPNDSNYVKITEGHLTQKLQIPKELMQTLNEQEKPKEETSNASKYVFEQINP